MSWGTGQQLNNNRYEIIHRIGTGGFGVTYKALDRKAATPNAVVAIKTLNEKRQRQANFEQLQENFLNEALSLAKCSHPHIIRVERVFAEGQIWAMVMDYIEGESLEDYLIDRGKLPEPKAVEIIQKIGGAVSYVHAQKLLHRDIKPANILIKPNGEPILIDFGLAREFVAGIARSMTSDRTPHYSPPEQAERRGDFQPPLDIYALAATLYTCVTGDLPQMAEIRLVRDSLIPPQQLNSGISDRVNRAILTGMALLSENRPQNIEEFLKLLAFSTSNNAATSMPVRSESIPAQVQPVLPLTRIQFNSIKVDAKGEIIDRPIYQAEVFYEDVCGITMVKVPTGKFMMGSLENPKHKDIRYDLREIPQHEVTIPEFYMSETLITYEQWNRTIPKDIKRWNHFGNDSYNPSDFKGDLHLPVNKISYSYATLFCGRLQELSKHGLKYRLPSEAEWEYACRAGTITAFAYGETITPEIANYDLEGNRGKEISEGYMNQAPTTVVKKFSPNPFGLYDMHGNLQEWCLDTVGIHEDEGGYERAPIDGNVMPIRMHTAIYRNIVRGGSWASNIHDCRSASRDSYVSDSCQEAFSPDVGFRVVFGKHLRGV
jgi:formylglycine-generating enzyme required for sulfatase activity/tRNA A-37 threonylcarbamoyl transferase component Bud32